MPGPTTEVLNQDIAEIRAEVRDVRVNLETVKDSLKAEVHIVALDLAKLSAEFNLFKWILGATLVATLSQIGAGIWWAATVTAEVRHLAQTIERQQPAPAPAPVPNPPVIKDQLKGM